MIHFIKNGIDHTVSGIHVIKDNALLTITNVYKVIEGQAILLWTLASELISSCFGNGYWINEEAWVNEEAWKN